MPEGTCLYFSHSLYLKVLELKKNFKKKNLENFKTFRHTDRVYRLTKYRGVSNQFFRAWIRFYIPTWDLDLILYLHTGPGFDSTSPHGTKFLAIHNDGLNSIWISFYISTCGLNLILHPHGMGDMYAWAEVVKQVLKPYTF